MRFAKDCSPQVQTIGVKDMIMLFVVDRFKLSVNMIVRKTIMSVN